MENQPSFYNSEKEFEPLEETSFYRKVQTSVLQQINKYKPSEILQFGVGIGYTTYKIGLDYKIIGVDIDNEAIKYARQNYSNNNIKYIQKDMQEYVKNTIKSDFILLMYSFHHIPDNKEGEDKHYNKKVFLQELYKNTKDDVIICISETFLQENTSIEEQAKKRVEEASFSVIDYNLDKHSLKDSMQKAELAKQREKEAWEYVKQREKEYLITLQWLINTSLDIGFSIYVEKLNDIGEYTIILKK